MFLSSISMDYKSIWVNAYLRPFNWKHRSHIVLRKILSIVCVFVYRSLSLNFSRLYFIMRHLTSIPTTCTLKFLWDCMQNSEFTIYAIHIRDFSNGILELLSATCEGKLREKFKYIARYWAIKERRKFDERLTSKVYTSLLDELDKLLRKEKNSYVPIVDLIS